MAQAQTNHNDAVSGLQPLSYLNTNQPANVLFVRQSRAPTTSDRRFKYGTIWLDTATTNVYCLVNVAANSASWALMSAGSSQVDTLTGDTGGAISPAGGNINILGGDNLTVAGSGSTLTINLDSDAYPITPYVVGPSGDGGYTTIQSAMDAANSAGGGVVYVQPGTYTENLTLYDSVHVVGLTFADAGGGVIISGTHTPPATGGIVFQYLRLNSATDVFNSAVAGSAHIVIADCFTAVVNGHLLNVPNWTGILEIYDVNSSGGTNDGCINNIGGATILVFSSGVGAGTSNSMIASGSIFTDAAEFNCPIDFQTGSSLGIERASFTQAVTLSNNTTGYIRNSLLEPASGSAITMSSSGAMEISGCVVDSSTNPAIAGAGAGTLTLEEISFMNNAAISSSLTLARGTTVNGTVRATTFDTDVAAAGVTLSGTTLVADGTDTNIGITVTPKGTGALTVSSGNLVLGAVATQLEMNGGAATDFIGTATLTAGTVTVANTNIAANDRIFIQRQSINGSSALGMFTYSISASTSFTITSVQPGTPASTETNDASIVMYWIVREN